MHDPAVHEDSSGARTRGGEPLEIEQAIEIGNIFKLGTRYSEPLGANYLDESGDERPVWMGSYGIGPARIVAAAVEQFADEHGISWPKALAPFAVHLVGIGKPGTPEHDAAERIYETLSDGGIDTIYDDREAGPGEKFAEAELLGCPLRLTVGKRAVESGEIEVQLRRGRLQGPGIPLDGGARRAGPDGGRAVAEPPVDRRAIEDRTAREQDPGDPGTPAVAPAANGDSPRLTLRRLVGLDRSGAPPPQTLAGQPLRPWTIPNAIGFLRLALIPVFLIVAFSSPDGTGVGTAGLFAVIPGGTTPMGSPRG